MDAASGLGCSRGTAFVVTVDPTLGRCATSVLLKVSTDLSIDSTKILMTNCAILLARPTPPLRMFTLTSCETRRCTPCTRSLIPLYLPSLARGRKEDTKRLLIELFHSPSLLNRQRLLGGYIPTFDEAEQFMALGTDAWQTFKLGTRMASDNMQDALIAHFEEVQGYANDHPSETGTRIHLFTDEVRQTASKQANPP